MLTDSVQMPSKLSKCGKILCKILFGLLYGLMLLILTAWATAAIYYSNLPSQAARTVASWLFFVFTAGICVFIRPLWRACISFGLLFLIVLVWWFLMPPSNTRNWLPDMAVLPYSVIDGSRITIYNIRDFDYKSTTDYQARYYDKTFDLDKLQTADLFHIFWGPKLIAHTMMSFGFGEQGYVCISVETRKEYGESYSAVKGFFRQFELFYVVGDERDLVKLRSNYRKENVYLYRLNAKPELVRSVFLDYFKEVNRLHEKPQWYNALTSNCTTNIRGHTKPYARGKWDWRLLANGYLGEMLYERKAVDTNLPFEEFKAGSKINEKALKADQSSDFSLIIRDN